MTDERRGPSENERLANEIQREWSFKIARFPENAMERLGIVNLLLIALEVLLIVSNNVLPLGLWKSFIHDSSHYRDRFNKAVFDQTDGSIDFTKIQSYHLWKGLVVPSLIGVSAYVITAILYLRPELYQWKPDLLQHYGHLVAESRLGRWIPTKWLNYIFNLYERRHVEYMSNTIQPADRRHVALQDRVEFTRVVRQVAINLLISIFAISLMWIVLLQAGVDTQHILVLPKSYVPPVQGLVWYLINDMFYFYPHWIAHTNPHEQKRLQIPQSLYNILHKKFKESHRLHHRCKANIGIAAWYCSVAEQMIFNLFPALLGPVLTQVLARAAGVEKIWGTHLVTLYVWIAAAASSSVMAHSGYRSIWNDPGSHDLHHERAFNPKTACNFGTLGVFDWLHGTADKLPAEETRKWQGQRDRQAALNKAAKRSGIELTKEQKSIITQPVHDQDWVRKDV
ncbi:hypothetical protein PFICI_06808 [Pestalotiopsis fici W106-1]|uniref:Fatty acid hydroxylase domain-containing protein n=1 Tax=Pestalotiopsis fici (strain W106-1 / CGMCC3.15140) TaxID=1229662 RepID=W3X9H2_PESFW|nr:uncharacterized protein PFICI_06808 [Pestalotiopsis fici W106-1]ETS81806.1 hypothetical protein PFICI_06808 [Pestalotiopsis fici W106-1]